jgi:hypothetical protein
MSSTIFKVIDRAVKLLFPRALAKNQELIPYHAAVCLFGTGVHAGYAYLTEKKEEIHVLDMYMMVQNGTTSFMVVDQTGRHFNVNNSLWYWKWDSIEDWKAIKQGRPTYVQYYGWRSPFFGLFPNIVASHS